MAQAQTTSKAAPRKSTAAPRKTATKAAVPQAAVDKVLEGGNVEVTDEQRAAEAMVEKRQTADRRKNAEVMAASAATVLQPEVEETNTTITDIPPEKVNEFQHMVQALATGMGIPPELVPVPPTPTTNVKAPVVTARTKDVKNDITRPAPETKCGRIWAVADEITTRTGAAATIAEVRANQNLRDINENTMKTQYARWRQYNGVTGRVTKPVAPQQPVNEGHDEGIAAYHGPERRAVH